MFPSGMGSKMGMREKHNRQNRLWDIQDGVCAHCGYAMPHPEALRADGRMTCDNAPSLDHVIPRSRGGVSALSNLVLAHRRCNEKRGDGRLPKRALLMWRQNAAILRESA